MKYAKMFGLLAVAAATLMAFAGSASATTLTDASGSTLGVGTIIHAENEGIMKFDGPVISECSGSTIEASVSNAGSSSPSSITAVIGISVLSFSECGNNTVTVISKGSLEIHTETTSSNNNGTVTWTGAEWTVLLHLPFNVTTHCIYQTNATDIGVLTGTTTTGSTATLDISGSIPVRTTDGICGTSPVRWTGSYRFTVPDTLSVD